MSYWKVVGIGALAGMRSLSAPALVSHHLAEHGNGAGGELPRLLSSGTVAAGLRALAVGEMVADKTPWIPDRTSPIALAGRAGAGALAGAAVCAEARSSAALGALIGALSAVAVTYAAHALRKRLNERLHVPDALLGAAEDAAVVALGRQLLPAEG